MLKVLFSSEKESSPTEKSHVHWRVKNTIEPITIGIILIPN